MADKITGSLQVTSFMIKVGKICAENFLKLKICIFPCLPWKSLLRGADAKIEDGATRNDVMMLKSYSREHILY